jgi:hypothetical protein
MALSQNMSTDLILFSAALGLVLLYPALSLLARRRLKIMKTGHRSVARGAGRFLARAPFATRGSSGALQTLRPPGRSCASFAPIAALFGIIAMVPILSHPFRKSLNPPASEDAAMTLLFAFRRF